MLVMHSLPTRLQRTMHLAQFRGHKINILGRILLSCALLDS
jgi:hypothetical protein